MAPSSLLSHPQHTTREDQKTASRSSYIMMSLLDNTFFLPSDILHFKAAPSINTDDAAASNDHQPRHLVICHKDDQSLYKATRKIGRTAKRLLASFITNSEKKCDGKCSCETIYWIKGGKNEDAIQKRLVNELGSYVDLQFLLKAHLNTAIATDDVDIESTDDTAVHVMKKFITERNDGDSSCDDNLSVVIIDLDYLIQTSCCGSTQHQFTNNDHQVYWEWAQKILTSLLSQIECDGHNHSVILHVKCTSLYQSVSDIVLLPLDTAKNHYATKHDIDANQNRESTSNSVHHDDETRKHVIRRLREKKSAAQCPLSTHPIRYITKPRLENDTTAALVEICRFYNYDSERGCLRSKRARNNPNVKGCELDHDHCHLCGVFGHCALECANHTSEVNRMSSSLEPMVFNNTNGVVVLEPLSKHQQQNRNDNAITYKLPALVVLGGRLRGRTLASCEMLSVSSDQNAEAGQWIQMPNLLEHRGSHAACSPDGTGLVFVMGGGGVDGNSDTVESYGFDKKSSRVSTGKWQVLNGRLSSPRHAFGSVACINNDKTVNLFAVGGWKFGSVSCESVDKLTFESSCDDIVSRQWDTCAPLLKPRRLHSVVASADGCSIYVFGGYVNERFTTPSIEKYDVVSNQWTYCDELPYGDQNCPLVQVILDWSRTDNSFLIFPFGSEKNRSPDKTVEVLRYTPNSDRLFSSVAVPSSGVNEFKDQKLCMPLRNWASFSVACWKSQMKAYLVGGTLDGKWTARTFELDLKSMKWKELPEMLCARRRSVALVVD
eukprot:scaffold20263_cov69-Cyclotella_meneghiniana.AAC.1